MLNRAAVLFAVSVLLPLADAAEGADGNTARHRRGGEVSIAAAANLVYTIDALNSEFRKTYPETKLTSTSGASGSLFAQIQNGAPFDLFLSADADFPARLVQAGLGPPSSLRIFATGRLVAWTTRGDLDLHDIAGAVRHRSVRRIAIAQPQTAPYGRAAKAVLDQLGVIADARPKFVVGESVTQTAQFVETGNADFGFVALSLVLSPRLQARGTWVEVPAALYASVPLDHAVVLTRRGEQNPAAKQYLDFLGGDPAKKILARFGYK
ncbi:MAG: molybdate ABC transporter substrate-binding protein [Opitutaceae bacterium]|nr:molybdate ABC transporter substrate-binding protein [Opitutaceae bacterium]